MQFSGNSMQKRVNLVQRSTIQFLELFSWTLNFFMGKCNLWPLKSAYLFQIAQEKSCDYLYKHLLKNTTNNDFERKTWIEFYLKNDS